MVPTNPASSEASHEHMSIPHNPYLPPPMDGHPPMHPYFTYGAYAHPPPPPAPGSPPGKNPEDNETHLRPRVPYAGSSPVMFPMNAASGESAAPPTADPTPYATATRSGSDSKATIYNPPAGATSTDHYHHPPIEAWRGMPYHPRPPHGYGRTHPAPPGTVRHTRDPYWGHYPHHPSAPTYFRERIPPPPPPKDTGQRSAANGTAKRNNAGLAIVYDDSSSVPQGSSPTQIANHRRTEVQNMGCTCKRTACLKLYCQCFGSKLHCGSNCRCLGCHNNAANESRRTEAMRLILSRNPTAFETKFLQAGSVATSTTVVAATAGSSGTTHHKLGCKCRKSACMKKYCECYAGNVKCSRNCRCMGCKNMGDRLPFSSMVGRTAHLAPRASSPNRNRSVEPWMAAKNLTFLKRGSPDKQPQNELNSMPSLASSSEGTSPGNNAEPKRSTASSLSVSEEPPNALLLAAMAMTEFGQKRPVPTRETPTDVKRNKLSSEKREP